MAALVAQRKVDRTRLVALLDILVAYVPSRVIVQCNSHSHDSSTWLCECRKVGMGYLPRWTGGEGQKHGG